MINNDFINFNYVHGHLFLCIFEYYMSSIARRGQMKVSGLLGLDLERL